MGDGGHPSQNPLDHSDSVISENLIYLVLGRLKGTCSKRRILDLFLFQWRLWQLELPGGFVGTDDLGLFQTSSC